MVEKFKIIFLEQAREFLEELDVKVKTKIIYNIDKSKILNDPELFKKLSDEIWEFRTKYNKLYYRLFAFWDKSERTKTLVVSTHGIIKKTKKVSRSEIEKAKSIRNIYIEQKNI